jgi:multidrug efflux pump subunit AcrB
MRTYNLSPDDIVLAVASSNVVNPSGNIYLGNMYPMVTTNAIVSDIKALESVPIHVGTYPTIFIKDVASVLDSSDIITSEALVNGRSTVYIPVTKRSDASTLSVASEVKENIPRFQSRLPKDIKVSYRFDQSPFVTHSIIGLTTESLLGALLAGIMVLLFLQDWRSAIIVIINIPISLLASVLALWLTGQTINLMTLGGLTLAVGILVDISTVVIENIHTHLSDGKKIRRAVADATHEVSLPLFLAMLCVLAVFLPSFAMIGAARALFVPLSLAVGFAMLAAYLLASTFVPILSIWVLRKKTTEDSSSEKNQIQLEVPAKHFKHKIFSSFLAKFASFLVFWKPKSHSQKTEKKHNVFEYIQTYYAHSLEKALHRRWLLIGCYLLGCCLIIGLLAPHLGTDIFPKNNYRQFQVRMRAPVGTRLEKTVADANKATNIIKNIIGPDKVAITLSFIGVPNSSYSISFIYQWNSGTHEGILQFELKKGVEINIEALQERLRKKLEKEMPDVKFSFEPSDIVSRVMSFGAPTPLEVDVLGPDLNADKAFAEKVRKKLATISVLRDVQFGQPLDYPSVQVNINRQRAGLLGAVVKDVTRSLVAATSSSRFTQPIFWANPKTGVGYQIQVEVPQKEFTSLEDVRNIPINTNTKVSTLLRNAADVKEGTTVGEFDRYNMSNLVSVIANIYGTDLGSAISRVNKALKELGKPPEKITLMMSGQAPALEQILSSLRTGLLAAIIIIFLLLIANFQSISLAFITVFSVPATISGVAILLWLTGTTLNLQSFMGAIMAIGVAVSNAILLVTFAERSRLEGQSAIKAAMTGGTSRLRPILMTSCAMIAGTLPMAIGFGGETELAPLGRAVIGGLILATLATIFVLPAIFSVIRERAGIRSPSLDPDDPKSDSHQSTPESERGANGKV